MQLNGYTMEKFLEKLFDIKKIPTRFIFVIWLSSGLILFVPEHFLTKLNLNIFLQEYGKYIGIVFIICTGFLLVTILCSIKESFDRKKSLKSTKKSILYAIQNLDFHEKALLREFFITRKSTLQLPVDNDTVVGLVNKRILYQASNIGFTYLHGVYYSYSIIEFARNNLMPEMIDWPSDMTEEEENRIINGRPMWAKERSRMDNLANFL